MLLGALLVLGQAGCGVRGADPSGTRAADAVPVYGYRVVHAYPHDPDAFTQGLIFAHGLLYESTGLRGRSSLREVELETGRILRLRELPERYFGEGIALYRERIVMLTWRARTGFVYERGSFAPIGRFHYPTEGWGITYDGRRLIMSDGSDTLYYLDPLSYQRTGQVQVTDAGRAVANLNELEYVEGQIYANLLGADRIARIDPDSGRVLGWVELAGLRDEAHVTSDLSVLNGIAYDEQGRRLFVTGKLWPALFQIRVVPR